MPTEDPSGTAGRNTADGDAGTVDSGATPPESVAEDPNRQLYKRIEAARVRGETDGAKKGTATLLAKLGVTNEDELGQLLDLGRKSLPKESDEVAKIKAQTAERERAQQAELAQKQAEIDLRDLRDEVREHLGDVRDAEAVMTLLGIGKPLAVRLAVKDGRRVVLDADGHVQETDVGKFVKSFLAKKENQYLVKATGSGGGSVVNPPGKPPRKNGEAEERPRSIAQAMAKAAAKDQ